MRESYGEGLASRTDPESCVGSRKAEHEALTGAHAGGVLSNFLGFTHICGQARKNGKFLVLRKTIRKRLLAKLKQVREVLRGLMHQPLAEVGKWLRSVVQGYFNYHAVPGNIVSLRNFRFEVSKLWLRVIRRRSQRSRITWELMAQLVAQWLPVPKSLHPYPHLRFDAKHPR